MPVFTSYDGIIAALTAGKGQEVFFSKKIGLAHVAGAPMSGWAYDGIPAAGNWVGAGGSVSATLVTCTNDTVGAIPIASPTTASGDDLYLLSAGVGQTYGAQTMSGTLMLIDRLADTGPLTTAFGGSCALTMPVATSLWARYADGIGVMAFVESLETTTPTASTTISLTYTNPAGTGSRVSGSTTIAATKSRAFGTSNSPFLSLAGGDTGIKTIESIQVGAVTPAASTIALVVCKPLLIIPSTVTGHYAERDLIIQTPKLPKLEVAADQSACLQWLFLPNAATTVSSVFSGSVSVVASGA